MSSGMSKVVWFSMWNRNCNTRSGASVDRVEETPVIIRSRVWGEFARRSFVSVVNGHWKSNRERSQVLVRWTKSKPDCTLYWFGTAMLLAWYWYWVVLEWRVFRWTLRPTVFVWKVMLATRTRRGVFYRRSLTHLTLRRRHPNTQGDGWYKAEQQSVVHSTRISLHLF